METVVIEKLLYHIAWEILGDKRISLPRRDFLLRQKQKSPLLIFPESDIGNVVNMQFFNEACQIVQRNLGLKPACMDSDVRHTLCFFKNASE